MSKRIRSMIDEIFSDMKMSAENLALRDELRKLECSAYVLRTDRYKERISDAEKMLEGLRDAIAQRYAGV